ncbi:5'-nucleotidase C-terminal domain-containing protein [Campylobacter fetus]|nr:5'-nucleotidase C-terminal domain-containing protein [Campylobacter fetus]
MNKLKKYVASTVIFAAFLLIFNGCANLNLNNKHENELLILHTNDHHGALLPYETKDGTLIGGVALQANLVKQMRNEYKNALLLDAGDVNTGSSLSNIFDAKPDILAFNALKYDAATLGNHEFDGTYEKLKMQMELSNFPWLSANVKFENNYIAKPYIIKDFNGFKVAIMGLTTSTTKYITIPAKFDGANGEKIEFLPEIHAAKETLDEIKNTNPDFVIALVHIGDIKGDPVHITSVDLANNTHGIDLIIDGHSHSVFQKPLVINGVPIVSAGSNNRYVGKAVLNLKDKKIKWNLVELTSKDFDLDDEMNGILEPFIRIHDEALNSKIITLKEPLLFENNEIRFKQLPIGRHVTDSMINLLFKFGIKADFGIINSGAIRSGINAGDVSKKDILISMPFPNTISAVSLKGDEVMELFNYIINIKPGFGGFAQISKDVSFTIDSSNKTILNLKIKNEPINPSKLYTIAVTDFLANGGDGYAILKKGINKFDSSVTLNEAFIEYLKLLEGKI